MKVKKGFMLREVAKNYVVVPVGQAAIDFNGIINLNETGAFLWKQLISESTVASLTQSLLDAYDIPLNIAQKDILDFINKLKAANLLE